jgi:hypothetical protein
MSHAISSSRSPGGRLLTGSPPRFQAVEYDGRFFVNPGSATGAWTGLWNGCVSCGDVALDRASNTHLGYSESRRLRSR